MERRPLVTRIGACLAVGGLAGCLGGATDDPNGEDGGDGDDADGPPFDAASDEPYERFEVGDADGTDVRNVAYVRNAGDEDRDISMTIDHRGEVVLERTETVPPDRYVEIVFLESGAYGVETESDDSRSEATVDASGSDDTRSRTVVTFRPGGVETRTETTASDG